MKGSRKRTSLKRVTMFERTMAVLKVIAQHPQGIKIVEIQNHTALANYQQSAELAAALFEKGYLERKRIGYFWIYYPTQQCHDIFDTSQGNTP